MQAAASTTSPLSSLSELAGSAAWTADFQLTAQTAALQIPAGVLTAGAFYKFTVVATSPGSAAASSSSNDTVVVYVALGGVSVTLPGGSPRTQSVASALQLTAAASDPSNATAADGSSLAFSYAWAIVGSPGASGGCPAAYAAAKRDGTAQTCMESSKLPASVKSLLAAAGATLTVPGSTLAAGAYAFQVTLKFRCFAPQLLS